MIFNNPDNFWSKVKKNKNHWIWTGGVNSEGVGIWAWAKVLNKAGKYDQKFQRVHRVAWFLKHNKIPEGVITPSCDQKNCVKHVRQVTYEELHEGLLQKKCKRGHDLTDNDNVYFSYRKDGRHRRECKKCKQIRNKKRYEDVR